MRVQLAKIHSRLGDLFNLNEQFDSSIIEYKKALALRVGAATDPCVIGAGSGFMSLAH
jgi:hypothetical protein